MLLQYLLGLGLLSILPLAQGYERYERASVARHTAPDRQLHAARLVSEYVTRDDSISLQNNVTLHYIEDTDKSAPLAAHMALSANLPTLVLEDVESQFHECDQSSIQIGLSPNTYIAFKKALAPHKEFYTVTTHNSCNSYGGRMPYHVSDVIFSDRDSTATLKILPVSWNDVYQIDLNFGPDSRKYQTYAQGLSRRQAATTTTTTTSFPFPTPSTTISVPASSSTAGAEFSLANSLINQVLLDGSSGDIGFTLKCLNCSSSGQLDIVSGTASSEPNQTTTGDITASLNGFGVFVSLELDILVEVTKDAKTSVELFSQGLPGLSITDLGSIGLVYEVSLIFASHAQIGVSLTSGFEVTVPDNSALSVSIDPPSASVTGFEGTTFNLLPFTAKEIDPTADISLTLSQQIIVGIDFFDGHFKVGAGFFLDAPKLELQVESVNHVDVNCNPTNDSSVYDAISSNFGNLTNIVPSIEFDAGALVEGSAFDLSVEHQTTFFENVFTFPTFCLAHQTVSDTKTATGTAMGSLTTAIAEASDWQLASVAFASATSASAASAASASAASASATASRKKNAATSLNRDSCLLSVVGTLVVSLLLLFA